MKHASVPLLVSLAFHALIVALCFPMLVDRKFAHRAIPVDFVLTQKEERHESAAERATTEAPLRAHRQTVAKAAGAAKEPRQIATARVVPLESVRPPGHDADAAGAAGTGEVQTGGTAAVAAFPPAGGEQRVNTGSAEPRPGRGESPGASGARAGGQDTWREAVRSEVRRTVEKNKVYPDRAKRMNWEGKVDLSFRVFEDGTIRDVRVAKSSGFQVLDDAAADLLRKLRLSYRPAEKMQLDLAVEYRLQ